MTKAKYLKEREMRLKAEGICVRCAQDLSTPGTTTCQRCKELKAASHKLHKRPHVVHTMRTCKCGRECARSSFRNSKCPICWDAENAVYEAPHRAKPRAGSVQAWARVGWCLGCGHPVRWGKTSYCSLCLDERKAS